MFLCNEVLFIQKQSKYIFYLNFPVKLLLTSINGKIKVLLLTPTCGVGSLKKYCFHDHKDKINQNSNLWLFPNAWESWSHRTIKWECQGYQPSHTLPMGMQNDSATSGNSLTVSDQAKPMRTVCTSNYTPRYLPERNKNVCLHNNIQMNIYRSSMHNQQNLKPPRWLSTRECINKLWHIHIMKCYPALLIHTTTRIDLKCILLNARNQNQKTPYCMKPYMWYCGKDKTTQIENRAAVATSWGLREKWLWRDSKGNFWNDGTVS